MWRKFLFILFCLSIAASPACQSMQTTDTNANTGNVQTGELDPANMPPGLSTSPLPLTGEPTPGIPHPANANKVPTQDVPGIPDLTKPGTTPVPKNTPPIPGIPSQETLKRQMNTQLTDTNVVNNPPKGESNTNSRPPEKPRGNRNQ